MLHVCVDYREMVNMPKEDNSTLNTKEVQDSEIKEQSKFLEPLQDFLDKNNIQIKDLFDWFLKKNQKEFHTRIKSSRIQFWLITSIITGIVAGLFVALFTKFILAETFLSILGIEQ